mgnify:CR=1 FL=1
MNLDKNKEYTLLVPKGIKVTKIIEVTNPDVLALVELPAFIESFETINPNGLFPSIFRVKL